MKIQSVRAQEANRVPHLGGGYPRLQALTIGLRLASVHGDGTPAFPGSESLDADETWCVDLVSLMAIARTTAELNRWSDLAIIRRAITARMPEFDGRAGLGDVAELCRRHALTRPGRDWNDVRDEMLMICCEWDLANDSLDAQSDACLDCLARFLS